MIAVNWGQMDEEKTGMFFLQKENEYTIERSEGSNEEVLKQMTRQRKLTLRSRKMSDIY